MLTRPGTLIIALALLTLNAAQAKWNPYVGIGGAGELAFDQWALNDFLIRADKDDPPVFSRGLQFEVGIASEQLELYAAYRTTNSQTQRFQEWSNIDIIETDTTYYRRDRYYSSEQSRGERRFLLGVRRKFNLSSCSIAPVIGAAVEIGQTIRRWHGKTHDKYLTYDFDDLGYPIIGQSYEVMINDKADTKRATCYAGLVDLGVEWRIADQFGIIALTQFELGGANLTRRLYLDQTFLVSQTLQIRFNL